MHETSLAKRFLYFEKELPSMRLFSFCLVNHPRGKRQTNSERPIGHENAAKIEPEGRLEKQGTILWGLIVEGVCVWRGGRGLSSKAYFICRMCVSIFSLASFLCGYARYVRVKTNTHPTLRIHLRSKGWQRIWKNALYVSQTWDLSFLCTQCVTQQKAIFFHASRVEFLFTSSLSEKLIKTNRAKWQTTKTIFKDLLSFWYCQFAFSLMRGFFFFSKSSLLISLMETEVIFESKMFVQQCLY